MTGRTRSALHDASRGFLLSPQNPKSSSTSPPNPHHHHRLRTLNRRLQNPNSHHPKILRPHLQNLNCRHLKILNPCYPKPLQPKTNQIVHQILSLLPTDDMVCTSVLSRRFLRQWTHSPHLHFTRNFSSESIELEDYPSIVDLCLSQRSDSPSRLISLRFPLVWDPDFPPTLDRWICFALARSVQELAFFPISSGNCFIKMPSSLFDYCSLTVLKLGRCSIPTVPPGSKLPTLRTLVLTVVEINDRLLADLLSCCPMIESASIGIVSSLKRVVIRSSFLKHLMVYNCKGLEVVDIAEAPEPRRLMYGGDVEKIRVGEVLAKIEEVALLSMTKCPFKNDFEGWRRLVAAITHARVLCINNWIFEGPKCRDFSYGDQPIIFKNVKELHWWALYKVSPGIPAEPWCAKRITADSLYGILSLLGSCPFLEQFCMQSTYYNGQYDNFQDDESCCGENIVLDLDDVGCELSCLKEVRINEFAGTKIEMRLLRYIASKATVLETVSLHYVGEMKDEVGDIRRELSNVLHASPHVDFSFQEFDENKVCPKHEYMWVDHMIV